MSNFKLALTLSLYATTLTTLTSPLLASTSAPITPPPQVTLEGLGNFNGTYTNLVWSPFWGGGDGNGGFYAVRNSGSYGPNHAYFSVTPEGELRLREVVNNPYTTDNSISGFLYMDGQGNVTHQGGFGVGITTTQMAVSWQGGGHGPAYTPPVNIASRQAQELSLGLDFNDGRWTPSQ